MRSISNCNKARFSACWARTGMGKSTLLKCIMGFCLRRRDRSNWTAWIISGLPPHLIARAGIGYVAPGEGVVSGPHGGRKYSDRRSRSANRRALGEIEASFPFLLKRLGNVPAH
jgi:branched-chain amino acid transport system ATP-binding protein